MTHREFGHGLTYSSFNFSMASGSDGDEFSLGGSSQSYTVKIANTGAMDSDEVCLVFMVPPRRPGVPTPRRQLLDFVSLTNGLV